MLGVVLSAVGMFLLVFGIQEGQKYDWGTIEDPFAYADQYRNNLELIAKEVQPRIKVPAAAQA